MELSVVLLAAFVVACSAIPAEVLKWTHLDPVIEMSHLALSPEMIEASWGDFKSEHDKSYGTDEEELKRKEIFAEHLKTINLHNYLFSKGLRSYTMGVNKFTDLSHQEFIEMMNGWKKVNRTSVGATYLSPNIPLNIPGSVDWRTKGYVTPVKDQKQCGSCWAFSATGSLEGQNFRKTGELVSLSEQNLVDCSGSYGNEGCNGGLMDNAFKYIKENGGIDTEESYPYEGKDDKCRYDPASKGATDKGFTDIPSGNEAKLTEAIATVGPISVAIDASHPSFQMYKKGVYDEESCSSESLDHGVLAVGYGTQDGKDYYLVKNSWGIRWGDNGYIYMSRNKKNQCGIATAASYPIV